MKIVFWEFVKELFSMNQNIDDILGLYFAHYSIQTLYSVFLF